jgi:hypothetical protein
MLTYAKSHIPFTGIISLSSHNGPLKQALLLLSLRDQETRPGNMKHFVLIYLAGAHWTGGQVLDSCVFWMDIYYLTCEHSAAQRLLHY